MEKKERNNLHGIIGGLLELLLRVDASQRGKPVYAKQESVIADLRARHPDLPKQRHLEDVFAEANRQISMPK